MGGPRCRQTLYCLSHQGSLAHGEPRLRKEQLPEGTTWLLHVECYHHSLNGDSAVKNPPAMHEIWVPSVCLEDPLEKEIETYSRILAWEIPSTEEPGGL